MPEPTVGQVILELAGHHVAGAPLRYRHGWKLIGGDAAPESKPKTPKPTAKKPTGKTQVHRPSPARSLGGGDPHRLGSADMARGPFATKLREQLDAELPTAGQKVGAVRTKTGTWWAKAATTAALMASLAGSAGGAAGEAGGYPGVPDFYGGTSVASMKGQHDDFLPGPSQSPFQAQMRSLSTTVGDAIELVAHAHHVAGTPYRYRHGWKSVDAVDMNTWVADQVRQAHAPRGPESYDEHVKQIGPRLSAAVAAGKSTDLTHTVDPGHQVYTPDRAKMHDQIVDEIWREQGGDRVPRDGHAVIAGGFGGAGKSTVLGKYAGIDQSKYVTVNPDVVKDKMAARGMVPKVAGLSPLEASTLIHNESSVIASRLAARAMGQKANLIHDISMSSDASVLRRVKALRDAGYGEVDAVFVRVPVETAVQRAMARHKKGALAYEAGTGYGGRYFPPDLIRASAAQHSPGQVYEDVKAQFDNHGMWDNSGAAPVKIEGTGPWA